MDRWSLVTDGLYLGMKVLERYVIPRRDAGRLQNIEQQR
jgi:hypothetical protein